MPGNTRDNTKPTQHEIVNHLERVPLLVGLNKSSLDSLATGLELRTVERGQYVLQRGGKGCHLMFLLSGRLQAIDLTESGREIGANFLIPGDYFGELSVIDGLPRPASVIAAENSLIGLLPQAQALTLIIENNVVTERLLKRMASSIRTAASYRTIIGIPNAFQRVFAFLNQFSKVAPGGLIVIEKMPTQQEIALAVNTSRETVSRALQSLILKGIVEKDLRRLIVRQPEALRAAASKAS